MHQIVDHVFVEDLEEEEEEEGEEDLEVVETTSDKTNPLKLKIEVSMMMSRTQNRMKSLENKAQVITEDGVEVVVDEVVTIGDVRNQIVRDQVMNLRLILTTSTMKMEIEKKGSQVGVVATLVGDLEDSEDVPDVLLSKAQETKVDMTEISVMMNAVGNIVTVSLATVMEIKAVTVLLVLVDVTAR